jgi:phage-related baseplate assembly protein
LDTSQGEWVDRRLNDFGMERKAGAAAYGLITIGRDSPSPISISISTGTIFQNETGELQYTTQSDVILNIGSTSVDVKVEAVDSGTAYNLPTDTILKQSGIAISGIEWAKIKLMGGGDDIESDDDYKNRVPDYFDSLSRGTAPAIEYAASRVNGVASVTLKENVPSKGWFTIYIDDGSGVANNTLLQTVRAVLEDYRAFTIQYVVDTAKLKDFETHLQIFCKEDTDEDTVKAAVQTAIVNYVNVLSMGVPIYLADLIYLARGVEGVENVRVSIPTMDVIPDVDQLLRTSAAKVVIE